MSSKGESIFVVGERVQYYSKVRNVWFNADVVNTEVNEGRGINIKFEADLSEMKVEDPENSGLVRRYGGSDRPFKISKKDQHNNSRRLGTNSPFSNKIGDSISVLFNGEWYESTFEKQVQAGIRVRFKCDNATNVVPFNQVESRIRYLQLVKKEGVSSSSSVKLETINQDEIIRQESLSSSSGISTEDKEKEDHSSLQEKQKGTCKIKIERLDDNGEQIIESNNENSRSIFCGQNSINLQEKAKASPFNFACEQESDEEIDEDEEQRNSHIGEDEEVENNFVIHQEETISTSKKCKKQRKSLSTSKKYFGVRATIHGNFSAIVNVNSSSLYLRRFPTEHEAARAYDKYIVEHKLNRALNFPKEHPEHVFKRNSNSSRFTGVRRQNNSFVAEIKVNGKTKAIGRYSTEEEAARARDDYIIQNNLKRSLNFPITENSTDSITNNNNNEEEEEEEETQESDDKEYNTNQTKNRSRKGVRFTRNGAFRAEVVDNGTIVNWGIFTTEHEAARAYDKYIVEHKLNRALNFPKEHPEHVFKRNSNSSRFTGVRRQSTNSFRADLKINGRWRHLGGFRTEEEAAMAYDDQILKHKLKRPLNFPK